MRTLLIIVAVVIVLGLLTYFVVNGLGSSTGKVIANNGITYNVIAHDDKVTSPARAANTNPTLPSDNSARLQ